MRRILRVRDYGRWLFTRLGNVLETPGNTAGLRGLRMCTAATRRLISRSWLREFDEHDLRRGPYPHGRTPGAGASRRVDEQVAKALETIRVLAKNAASTRMVSSAFAT